MNGSISETANFQQTGGQLIVGLNSPKTGGAVTSSPVAFPITVAGFVQGASLTVLLNGARSVPIPRTLLEGSLANPRSGRLGTHSWYATATKMTVIEAEYRDSSQIKKLLCALAVYIGSTMVGMRQ